MVAKLGGTSTIVISLLLTVCIALSGWAMNEIVNLPKDYVLKDDFGTMRNENREDHKEMMRILRDLERG